MPPTLLSSAMLESLLLALRRGLSRLAGPRPAFLQILRIHNNVTYNSAAVAASRGCSDLSFLPGY